MIFFTRFNLNVEGTYAKHEVMPFIAFAVLLLIQLPFNCLLA